MHLYLYIMDILFRKIYISPLCRAVLLPSKSAHSSSLACSFLLLSPIHSPPTICSSVFPDFWNNVSLVLKTSATQENNNPLFLHSGEILRPLFAFLSLVNMMPQLPWLIQRCEKQILSLFDGQSFSLLKMITSYLGHVMHAYNISTEEAKAEGSMWVQG